MVTIISCKLRKNQAGKEFVSLDLQGDPEFVQSTQTGRFYLTARRCSMPSTFTKEAAEMLIGKSLPGNIVRVEAEEPYDYTVPETGEVIRLMHSYSYVPEASAADLPKARYSHKLLADN